MLNTVKKTINKYRTSKTWTEFLYSCIPGMDAIYDELSKAKNDKQRAEILERGLNLANDKVRELMEENIRLKEQMKDNEEVESILSGSGSSDESINSQRQKRKSNLYSVKRPKKKSKTVKSSQTPPFLPLKIRASSPTKFQTNHNRGKTI